VVGLVSALIVLFLASVSVVAALGLSCVSSLFSGVVEVLQGVCVSMSGWVLWLRRFLSGNEDA
jgi:hypothetical protein